MALVRVFFVPDAVSRASFTLNASNECDDCTDEIKQKKITQKKYIWFFSVLDNYEKNCNGSSALFLRKTVSLSI